MPLQHGAKIYLYLRAFAEYRVGQYQKALDDLTRFLLGPGIDIRPGDLAFLTMTQHRLGQKEQAQATLRRLQETMKKPEWATHQIALSLLREADALVNAKAGEVPK